MQEAASPLSELGLLPLRDLSDRLELVEADLDPDPPRLRARSSAKSRLELRVARAEKGEKGRRRGRAKRASWAARAGLALAFAVAVGACAPGAPPRSATGSAKRPDQAAPGRVFLCVFLLIGLNAVRIEKTRRRGAN